MLLIPCVKLSLGFLFIDTPKLFYSISAKLHTHTSIVQKNIKKFELDYLYGMSVVVASVKWFASVCLYEALQFVL